MNCPTPPTVRSTVVRMYLELCPHAVELYNGGGYQDRSIFAAGTAAHDIAHAVGIYPDADREEVARVVCNRLIETGRTGVDAEGPLNPVSVFAGRDIFMEWLARGNSPHPHPNAAYETGMAFKEEDGELVPCQYGAPESVFRIHPDVVYEQRISGEDGYGVGIVTRDYKTAWNANATTLETIQLKAQAVSVVKQASRYMQMRPDFVRREVVNLRTGGVYYKDTWLDAQGLHRLKTWERDIITVVNAVRAAAGGPAEARVGSHCLSCPYVQDCKARKEAGAAEDPQALAQEFILLEARRKELIVQLKAATKEDPIPVDKSFVGYSAKSRDTVLETVPAELWKAWARGMEIDPGVVSSIRGLLKAMRVGKTQLEKVAKSLFPERTQVQERAVWVSTMTKTVTKAEFGAWKKE